MAQGRTPTGCGLGLYRPRGLVYLQTTVVVKKFTCELRMWDTSGSRLESRWRKIQV
jgi:hypothetical protein